MAKNKNNQAIWNTRIRKKLLPYLQKLVVQSILIKDYIKKIFWVQLLMLKCLFKQKIISFKIKNKIIYGLQKIEKKFQKINLNLIRNMKIFI